MLPGYGGFPIVTPALQLAAQQQIAQAQLLAAQRRMLIPGVCKSLNQFLNQLFLSNPPNPFSSRIRSFNWSSPERLSPDYSSHDG